MTMTMTISDQGHGEEEQQQQQQQLDGKPVILATSLMSPERRIEVEKKLKRKLDARCAYFIVIYIMNCEYR